MRVLLWMAFCRRVLIRLIFHMKHKVEVGIRCCKCTDLYIAKLIDAALARLSKLMLTGEVSHLGNKSQCTLQTSKFLLICTYYDFVTERGKPIFLLSRVRKSVMPMCWCPGQCGECQGPVATCHKHIDYWN